jgi:hypothetical protein
MMMSDQIIMKAGLRVILACIIMSVPVSLTATPRHSRGCRVNAELRRVARSGGRVMRTMARAEFGDSKAPRSGALHDAVARFGGQWPSRGAGCLPAEINMRMAPSSRIVIFTEALGPQFTGLQIIQCQRAGLPTLL